MKKLVSFMLTVLLVCLSVGTSLVFASEAATSGMCDANLAWRYDGNTATLYIEGSGDMISYGSWNSEKEDFDVYMTPWNAWRDSIKNVVISDGVTSVGDMAFANHKALENVKIGGDVARMSASAFRFCKALVSVSVDTDNKYFSDIGGVVYSKDMRKLVYYPCGKKDTSFDIPASVKVVENDVFFNAAYLESVTIPFGIDRIGDRAFSWCTSLREIYIPGTIQYIGEGAFSVCTSMKKVELAMGVFSVEKYAFSLCQAIESLILPHSVLRIEQGAFADSTSAVVSGYVGSYAETFAKNNGLVFRSVGTVPWVPAPIPENAVAMSVPTFGIRINGAYVENSTAKYPCMVYNDITYFPMTYFGARSLGLTADYTPENGLVIERAGTAPFVPEFEQHNMINTMGEAVKASGKITVNGKVINNAEEEYPIILYRDITYFPLTWRFAVEEFGWSYSFDDIYGLSITCN